MSYIVANPEDRFSCDKAYISFHMCDQSKYLIYQEKIIIQVNAENFIKKNYNLVYKI